MDLSAGPLPDSSILNKALEHALMASSKPLYEAMVGVVLGWVTMLTVMVPPRWGRGVL